MKTDSDPTASIFRRIRVRTEDSAFVYQILEASEGVCAYSTLPHQTGDRHRDLELIIPVGQIAEMDRVMTSLHTDLKGEIFTLGENDE